MYLLRKFFWSYFLIVFFLPYCASTDPYTNLDEFRSTINGLDPDNILLSGITILAQPNASTCGITATTVISNYMNQKNQNVEDLIQKYNVDINKGTTVEDLLRWLSAELPGREVTYHKNESVGTMLEQIHASLNQAIPVAIFFGASNPYNIPLYDFHASVIYGINLQNETITIANSYGFSEEASLVDFLNRMAFTEIDKYPSGQQFAITFNLIDKNMYFIIK